MKGLNIFGSLEFDWRAPSSVTSCAICSKIRFYSKGKDSTESFMPYKTLIDFLEGTKIEGDSMTYKEYLDTSGTDFNIGWTGGDEGNFKDIVDSERIYYDTDYFITMGIDLDVGADQYNIVTFLPADKLEKLECGNFDLTKA